MSIPGYTPILSPGLSSEPSSLHRPLPGAAPVTLFDHAYGKHTRQSSAAREPYSGWAFATEAEAAPWWEIDLGEALYVERVALWLAPLPTGTEIEVALHGFHTPAGAPAPGCQRHHLISDDLPTGSDGSLVVWLSADAVARHVRVTLRRADGAEVALLLRGAEIPAAALFTESLLDCFARAFTIFADRPLFSARPVPGAGAFAVTHTYGEVWRTARALAAALGAELERPGVEARIFLGLCTRNRPEWVVGDLAALMRGYVVVPLSPDDPEERLREILTRCPLDAVICEAALRDRFARLAVVHPALRLVVSCDDAPSGSPSDGVAATSFAALVGRGAEITPPDPMARSARDLFTVLFTSGSSGVPKGAMRSHATFLAMLPSYGVAQPAYHLSFQPLSHVSERMYLPAVMLQGGLIGLSAGGAHLLSDLHAFEPSMLGSVPRLFEIVHADHRRRLAAARSACPAEPEPEIERRVLAESRRVFGSRLQAVGVGSAPVSAELLAFLHRCFADIWVADGYGSTEHGTIASDGQVRPNVEIKLVAVEGAEAGPPDRGEIWVRTPHLIDGYYGDPEATRESLDAEGYFRTGDLGERTASGGVQVIGRVRNVIKLGQGEFVAVDRVEAVLASCPLVDQVFVHPDATSSALLAVVVPSVPALGSALGAEVSTSDLGTDPAVERALLRAVHEHGSRAGLAGFELPRAVLIEPEPFTVASGLLTASGKLARPAAVARYASRLAELGRDKARAREAMEGTGRLSERLAAVVGSVIGRPVDPEDRIHQGLALDSLSVAEVLRAAALSLGREIPLRAWFAASTLAELAGALDRGMLGRGAALLERPDRDLELPLPGAPGAPAHSPFRTIVLTGATGLLGAHLLEALCERTRAHVVCLVRAPSDEVAARRVRETLHRYAIPSPEPRWSAVAADLGAPGLGLEAERRGDLAERADAVVHAGAAVSWLLPYDTLRAANVLGTHALLGLAMTGRSKPFHHVSTISVAPPTGDETSSLTLAEARAGGGYALSKWVAEALARRAASAGHSVAIYRPSMITGHSARGIGNPDDYVHRYLAAAARAGRGLDSTVERLDMTPVDFVAGAIVALMLAHPEGGGTHHLTNIEGSLTYAELGEAMTAAGYPVEPVDHTAFRAQVVGVEGSPLGALGAFFPEQGFTLHMGPWPAERTRDELRRLGVECPAIDERMIALYLAGLSAR